MNNFKPKSSARRRGGFTLLEILVAVGIIVLLSSILIPVVAKARRSAGVIRIQRDLETIATALEAYKGIYQMYPPITPLPNPINAGVQNDINNVDAIPMYNDNGAHALYTALMMRGNQRLTHAVDSNGALSSTGGSVPYGPLLEAGKVKVAPDPSVTAIYEAVVGAPNMFICDANGHPILYVPASQLPLNYTKSASITTPPHFFVQYGKFGGSTDGVTTPRYYDFRAIPVNVPDPSNPSSSIVPFHNSTYTSTPQGLSEFQVLMGDENHDGIIDSTATPTPEQAAYTGPYLLWSAGADGQFGINASSGLSDDVANFPVPQKYRGQ